MRLRKNNAGINVIEMTLLMALFACGFTAGHIVANMANNLWVGILVGFMTCYGIAVIYGNLVGRWIGQRRSVGAKAAQRSNQRTPNQASEATSEPAPSADSSSPQG